MRITPMDIEKQDFRSALRGYDKEQVRQFLMATAAQLEAQLTLTRQQREDQSKCEAELRRLVEQESTLKQTLVAAQQSAATTFAHARKDADLIVARAEQRADQLLEMAQLRLTELLADIAELKRQKTQYLAQLKSLIECQQRFVQLAEDDEKGHHIEENLSVLRGSTTASDAREKGNASSESSAVIRFSKG